jgi:hypothetical protein
MHIGFWWEIQKERDHQEDLRSRWDNNIRMDLREREREDGMVWIGLMWLRIGTSGGPL